MSAEVPLGYATVDLTRTERLGLPEIIYGPGKTAAQIGGIAAELLERTVGPVLATRVTPEVGAALEPAPRSYDEGSRTAVWRWAAPRTARVALVTAGTADGPVADEAAGVATAIGLTVDQYRDVGVAGLDRLLRRIDDILLADVVVVIAGMEAALASVVGGLVAVPVVAVPTSTGYGAAFEGVTALLAMAASCANGITVVNIDSGYAAALAAHRLAVAIERKRR